MGNDLASDAGDGGGLIRLNGDDGFLGLLPVCRGNVFPRRPAGLGAEAGVCRICVFEVFPRAVWIGARPDAAVDVRIYLGLSSGVGLQPQGPSHELIPELTRAVNTSKSRPLS